MASFTIEATDYDEAFELAVDDYRYDILEKMIENDCNVITIDFGSARSYEFRGADDYEFIEIGSFDLSFEELDIELNDFIVMCEKEKK